MQSLEERHQGVAKTKRMCCRRQQKTFINCDVFGSAVINSCNIIKTVHLAMTRTSLKASAENMRRQNGSFCFSVNLWLMNVRISLQYTE